MRRQLQNQIVEEIKAQATALLSDSFHESFQQVIEQLGIVSIAKTKIEQRKEIVALTKRIFDTTEGAKQVNQRIKNMIAQKMAEPMKVNLEQSDVVALVLADLLSILVSSSDKNRVTTFSFDIAFGKELSPKARSLLWESRLKSDLNSKQFYKYDHQTKRVKLEQEMREQILSLVRSLSLKLHSDTINNIVRLAEYVFRKHSKVVSRPVFYLACNLGSVFNDYSEFKINALGGYFVSLIELADFYNTAFSDEEHMQTIIRALELVDSESVRLFEMTHQQKPKQVLKYFKEFIQSLGSIALNSKTAKYLIDQLLIKPHNKFDIHLAFAMVVLLVTSDGDKSIPSKNPQQPPSSTDREPESRPQLGEEKDLFDYLAKSTLIEVQPFAKVIQKVYDGIVLFETNYEGIPNEALQRQNRPLKSTAIRGLLDEYRQFKKKINVRMKTVKQATSIGRKTMMNKEPGKQHYGLISLTINMDE